MKTHVRNHENTIARRWAHLGDTAEWSSPLLKEIFNRGIFKTLEILRMGDPTQVEGPTHVGGVGWMRVGDEGVCCSKATVSKVQTVTMVMVQLVE